jgi:hypothetical protein
MESAAQISALLLHCSLQPAVLSKQSLFQDSRTPGLVFHVFNIFFLVLASLERQFQNTSKLLKTI